jgi:predicted ATP-dependent endonuclease of OLD family
MKLTSIRIEKFRAIRESDILVSSELALVGQNSAGSLWLHRNFVPI